MVIFHAEISFRDAELAWHWRPIIQTLETLRMPLFFFASGLVSAKILTQSFATLWTRRIAFFLYLYIVWTLLRTLYGQVVHTPQRPRSWDEAIYMFVVPHASLWFIYALAIFAALVWLGRKLPAWIPLSASLLLSLAFTSGAFNMVGQTWVKAGSYLFFFISGIYLRNVAIKAADRISIPFTIAAGVLYVIAGSAWVATPIGHVPGARFLFCVLGVVAGVCVSVQLARLRSFRWTAHLGRNTLPVYLLHPFFLVAGACLAIEAGVGLPVWGEVLVVPAATAIAIVLSICVYPLTVRIPGLYDAPWFRTNSEIKLHIGR